MSKYRKSMSRGRSKKQFSRGARIKRKNYSPGLMRGGYRL